MKKFLILLLVLLFVLIVSAEKEYDDLESDEEEEIDEADEEAVTHDREYVGFDKTIATPTSQKTIQPKPSTPLGLHAIVGYTIAGVVAIILLVSLVVGIIAGVTTVARTPVKYDDIILNSKSGNSSTPLISDEDQVMINVEKKLD